jgi:PPOX class probable F420-dependent enzyme
VAAAALPTVAAKPELATATRKVSVTEAEMRERVAAARVGQLATVRSDGTPHIVPICFALLTTGRGDVVVSGTDEKPKSTFALQRLRNIAERPAAALLVDHYEEDWTRVWWIRVDGRGRVINDDADRERAVAALRAKYHQYEHVGIPGAVLAIDVDRWLGWAYTDG